MSRDDEERLPRRVAEGDLAAFDEFYRRTSPWLGVRLRRRCADEQLFAEVLQDTYGTVWRAAGSFVGSAAGGSALGSLWTVAARRLVDAFRAESRHQNLVEAATGTVLVEAPTAEETLLASTLSGDVGDALGSPAPELREVLQAMVLGGLSVRDTSVPLGIPEGTVPPLLVRIPFPVRVPTSGAPERGTVSRTACRSTSGWPGRRPW